MKVVGEYPPPPASHVSGKTGYSVTEKQMITIYDSCVNKPLLNDQQSRKYRNIM